MLASNHINSVNDFVKDNFVNIKRLRLNNHDDDCMVESEIIV